MIDLALLQQNEATQNQYIFNFVLMNIIFIFTYIFRNNKRNTYVTWFLVLIFVLFAYWDTDYFSFRRIFYSPELKDFRDPLYYYLSFISFHSYTIFRLIIWGTGLLLFKKTISRFGISSNIAIYIFSIFFLLTYSYARVSFGMAMYFYGLSYIIIPNKKSKTKSKIWGLIFVCCSFLGHRSMAALIALTPICMIKLDKKRFIIIALLGVAICVVTAKLLTGLMTGSIELSDSLGAAGEAAEQYASIGVIMEYNWKFALMRNLRFYSFYIACAYITWKVAFSSASYIVSPSIKQLSTYCLGILIFAASFLTTPTWGADIIGYRYLYMLGIPLCIILSYMNDRRYTKQRTNIILILPAFLYAEGFILGKILSL